jgi:hypothetical protein
MTEYLNFLGTTIRFDVDPDVAALFALTRSFFTHLMSDTPAHEPDFRISITSYDPETEVPPEVWSTAQQIIRRSKAPEFDFDAHVLDGPGRRLYINKSMYLDVPLDAMSDNRFAVRATGGSKFQLLDLIRDLIIRHEESRGTVVLHASGIRDEHGAVVIAGPKGAGKTTTMLSSLRRSEWKYFTGDKLFCEVVAGDVWVHPWRDYPYIGVGSIRSDPRLEDLVRCVADPKLDARADDDKILIQPELFDSWMGITYNAAPQPLQAIFLPEVRPGEPLRVSALTEGNERRAHLNKIIDRQADTTFFTWQSYLVPDYARFFDSLRTLGELMSGIPMIRLSGTLDVDPTEVLRQAQAQAQNHQAPAVVQA